MFHKTIIFILSIALLLGLSACTVKEESSAESIPSAEINGEEEQLSKKLVPLDYQEGEEVESLYYRINKVDGQLCYEVQPEGEKERMQIPVDSVIYIVSSPDESKQILARQAPLLAPALRETMPTRVLLSREHPLSKERRHPMLRRKTLNLVQRNQ